MSHRHDHSRRAVSSTRSAAGPTVRDDARAHPARLRRSGDRGAGLHHLAGGADPKLTVEQRAIAGLCRDILSIAEISARLDLPLGVTRVLVGDMADEGLVLVYRPAQVGDRPDLALLERVLYGLRTL